VTLIFELDRDIVEKTITPNTRVKDRLVQKLSSGHTHNTHTNIHRTNLIAIIKVI